MPTFAIARSRAPLHRSALSLGALLASLALGQIALAQTEPSPLTPEQMDILWPPDTIQAVPAEISDLGFEPGPSAPTPEEQAATAARIEAAKAARDTAAAAIRALLKTPVDTPVPPALGAACEEDDVTQMLTDQLVTGWVRTASDPEASLLSALEAARRELQALGADDGTSYELEEQIALRLGAKARAVMAANRKNPDTLPAVVALVRTASRLAGMLGQSAEAAALLDALAAWLTPFVPGMVEKLRKEHDYAMVIAIIRMVRQMNSLGVETGTSSLESVLADIEKAMHFELTLTYSFTVTGANGNVEAFTLKAKVPLDFRIDGAGKDVHAMLVGEGPGSYLSYTESDGKLTMQAPGFTTGAKIESFDPCAGKATLFVDRFYAEAETYLHPDGTAWELNMAEVGWMVLFEKNQNGSGWVFDIPVTNRAKIAVDTTISATQGVFDGKLIVTLDHMPK